MRPGVRLGSVWLLNGCQEPIWGLKRSLMQHCPQVEWHWPAAPPDDAVSLALALQAGQLKLVLLVGEQAQPTSQETRWRQWLHEGAWPHAVLPVDASACTAQPGMPWIERLVASTGWPLAAARARQMHRAWRTWGGCEDCSDPDGEQHLFMALLTRRSMQTG